MYIGDRKEKLIASESILSFFKQETRRELYKVFVENSLKSKANDEDAVV